MPLPSFCSVQGANEDAAKKALQDMFRDTKDILAGNDRGDGDDPPGGDGGGGGGDGDGDGFSFSVPPSAVNYTGTVLRNKMGCGLCCACGLCPKGACC